MAEITVTGDNGRRKKHYRKQRGTYKRDIKRGKEKGQSLTAIVEPSESLAFVCLAYILYGSFLQICKLGIGIFQIRI